MSKSKPKPPAPPAAAPPRDSLATLVIGLLGLVLALELALFAYHSWLFVRFPFQIDYGEGPILQIAVRFARGQALYPPLDQGYPYVIASYMPLYYVLSGLLVHLTGPSFLGGRLLSVLSALLTALCCGAIVWEHTRRRFAAFLAGALVLAMPIVLVWASLMRTDLVGLAFSVAGFWLFTRGNRATGTLAFVLAVLTRWTNLAAIAGALAALVFARKWKEAALWGGVQLAALLVAVLGSNALTHGGMFHQLSYHTSSSLGKSWTWDQVFLLLRIAAQQWPAFFLIGALGALWCAWRPAHRAVAVYFAAAWMIFFTSGRIGSTFNYLMEPVAVGAMATGIMWAGLEAFDARALRGAARAGMLAMAGALALQMVHASMPGRLEYTISLLRPQANGAASALVLERIKEAPGPTLCEDVGLQVMADKEVPLDPFEFTQLAHKHAFDPAPVYADARAGKFALIVLRFDPTQTGPDKATGDWGSGRWPDGLIQAVKSRYTLQERADPYLLYVPKR